MIEIYISLRAPGSAFLFVALLPLVIDLRSRRQLAARFLALTLQSLRPTFYAPKPDVLPFFMPELFSCEWHK
jgi:hypothetical protein